MNRVLKLLIIIFVGGVLAVSLAGCQPVQSVFQPTEMQNPSAIIMQEQLLRACSLTIYLPTVDFSDVTTQNISVQLLPYESTAEAAIKTMLRQIRAQDEKYDFSLISLAVTDQTAIVNLAGEFGALTENQLFSFVYCVTDTLCELDSISYVVILANDKALEYHEIPYGTLMQFDEDVKTAFWQFSSAADEAGTENTRFSKKVSLYFGSTDDAYLIAEPQDITFVSGYLSSVSIVAALAAGPLDTSAVRLLPSTAFLSFQSLQEDAQTGQLTLSLRIEGSVYAYWTRNNIAESLAAASVAMTFFDYYPNLDIIQLSFDKQEENSLSLCRAELELRIGTTLELYYPNLDGGITKVRRAVSTFESHSIDRVFELMYDRPAFLGNEQIQAVFPEPIDKTDILSVTIDEKTAIIQVSSRFVQTIRSLDASRERDVIFSIVNTLCRTQGIDRVSFLENTELCQSIPGRITLSDYLYYNPGIIKE